MDQPRWESVIDRISGKSYYVDHLKKTTSYKLPKSTLPLGWEERVLNGKSYYVDYNSGVTTSKKPKSKKNDRHYGKLSGESVVWDGFSADVFQSIFERVYNVLITADKYDIRNLQFQSAQFDILRNVLELATLQKQNKIINLDLQVNGVDGSLGHANLLVVDAIWKELYRWEPHGVQSPLFTAHQLHLMDKYIYQAAREVGYTYIGTQACLSAPQNHEGECTTKLGVTSSGFCASYSLVFGLLYARAHVSFRDLENRLGYLMKSNPCMLFDIFLLLSDTCAKQMIAAFPSTAKILVKGKGLLPTVNLNSLDQLTYQELKRFYNPLNLSRTIPEQDVRQIIDMLDTIIKELGLKKSNQKTLVSKFIRRFKKTSVSPVASIIEPKK